MDGDINEKGCHLDSLSSFNKPIIITFLAMEKVIFFLYHYNASAGDWFTVGFIFLKNSVYWGNIF